MPKCGESGWLFVTGEGQTIDQALVDEALAAAPRGVRDGAELLPRRRPTNAPCRICRRDEPLTREHVPPRSAGNDRRSHAHTVWEWLARNSLDEVPGGRFEQGGMWGYTLCGDCNSRTGRLSDEYRRWVAMAARLFNEDLPHPDELNQSVALKHLHIAVPRCRPGAFARQVLSLMVSVSGPWALTDLYPELRAAVLNGTCCELAGQLQLGMALCAGPAALAAGPSLVLDHAERTWRWVSLLAFPPFAFELELAASQPASSVPSPLCDIGNLLTVEETAVADVELEVFVGFTNTVFPGDWRSRAQIERGLDIYGRP